jgi:2-succinyl-5-enolpyruvyl-6-hydroxy-3-cyclohexene-1-carboxylate synthase
MNISLAEKILSQISAIGCEEIVLCAGARNAPLVAILEKCTGYKVWNFFDERSAGFFALGRAQASLRPVCVVTTSGTAVAELVPVAVEATYTQTPLIFLTADRPRHYRGSGAPQSIDQVGIFFKYVETCKDVASTDESLDISDWSKKAPLQVNVCFSEPLLDTEIPALNFKAGPVLRDQVFSSDSKRTLEQPLVVVSGLSLPEAELVSPFLEKFGAPIFAESTSNLRNRKELQYLLLKSPDSTVKTIFAKGLCKSVLRIGGVPTLRFWRDLEEKFREIPVFAVSQGEFTGLSRPVKHTVGLENLKHFQIQWNEDRRKNLFEIDSQQTEKFQRLLQKYPRSELALLSKISEQTSAQNFYVGNSLPIREWDLVCPYLSGPQQTRANRGANGIDGQISTFLGLSEERLENWAVIGDLTAMYDLSALWIAKQMEKLEFRIVVINNGGGMIFKNMFQKDIFLNRHQIEFSHWAKMWDWHYEKWTEIPKNFKLPQQIIIELVPDSEQSQAMWKEMQSL